MSSLANPPGTCAIESTPRLTIGEEDSEPEYQLYRVFGAAKTSAGQIAVVNQGTQELRMFDSEGRFLGANGRQGEGPGEFRAAFTLHVAASGDSLWVGDYRPWEFEVFDAQGTWVRGMRPSPDLLNPPYPFGLTGAGFFVTSPTVAEGFPTDYEPEMHNVVVYDPQGNVVDTLGTFRGMRRGLLSAESNFVGAPHFESGFELAAGPDRIALGRGDRAEIEVREGSPPFAPLFRLAWDTEPERVTQRDVERERERILAASADRSEEEIRMFVEPRVRPSRPAADTFPVFTGMGYGRDGTLWVEIYQKPGEEMDAWLAFDRDGQLLCSLEEPGYQIVEFGADYVLVEAEGSQGQEIVQEFALGRPGM